MTKEQEKNVTDNLYIIDRIIDNNFPEVKLDDRDDLYQEGCIGLMRAVTTYDETKKTNIKSYITMNAYWQMFKYYYNVIATQGISYPKAKANTYKNYITLVKNGLSEDEIIKMMDETPEFIKSLRPLVNQIESFEYLFSDYDNEYFTEISNDVIDRMDIVDKIYEIIENNTDDNRKRYIKEYIYNAYNDLELNKTVLSKKYGISATHYKYIIYEELCRIRICLKRMYKGECPE